MSKRGIVWLCLIVIIAAMFYGLTPMMAEQDSVYRTFAPLVEVDALIQRRFVRELDRRTLVDGAIRGMVLALDPYSAYVADNEMADFKRRNTGQYVGIGVELGVVDGGIVVVAPWENSPAARAGIRPGDRVLAVDGRRTEDVSAFDVEGWLVGEPDTTVTLRIKRPDGSISEPTMIRAEVLRHPVKGVRRLTGGAWDYTLDEPRRIAYVRISDFSKGMIADFDTAMDAVRRSGATALIIDLRFNPGGLLAQAVALVDRFISDGVIVTTVTRYQATRTYTASPEDTLPPIKLAILVNGGSASSSEITSGAFQDHERAVIIGERTFGKGSVQNFLPLHDERTALRLTVAYYQLPGGRIIHRTPENLASDDWGVTPDIVVPLTSAEYEAILRNRLTVDLAAIDEDQSTSDAIAIDEDMPSSAGDSESHADAPPRIHLDRQIQAAVDWLTEHDDHDD